MAEPGGYLQWDEENSISKMPVYTSRTDAAQAQLRCYIRRHLWPRTKLVSLPVRTVEMVELTHLAAGSTTFLPTSINPA